MIKRTGQSRIAVVGWGRGMGHKGHMYLASAVITQAQAMNADPYFFVSQTVGKDDPIYPDEKVAIYQKVFPQHAPIFQSQGNLNQALKDLAELGYEGVVLVVGADQKQAFGYLERPNKEGVPVYQSFGFKKLKVISRQETKDPNAQEEGPRATPMREILLKPHATEEEKFKVWRRDMPETLGDDQVRDLMHKAESRLMGMVKTKKIKEYIDRLKPMLKEANSTQKSKLVKLLSEAKKQLEETRIIQPNAKIDAYYVSPKNGKRYVLAKGIPYYLLSKLTLGLNAKGFAIDDENLEVRPSDVNQYIKTGDPELAEDTIDMPFGSISGQDVDIGLQHRNEQIAYSGLKRLGLVDTSEQFLTLQEIAKMVTDSSNFQLFAFDTNPVRSYTKLIKMIGWNKNNPTEYDIPNAPDEQVNEISDTTEDKESKIADAVIGFYKPVVDNIQKEKVDDYVEQARELMHKAPDNTVREKLIDIFKKGKTNPYLQGGIITTVGALLAGGVLSSSQSMGLNPAQTNLALQAILNTVIPTIVSRVNGKNWIDTIKYTLASAGVGTGIAGAGLLEESQDYLEEK